MYSVVSTAIARGIESIPIQVEADISDGMPVFDMVGYLGAEVREAKERVRTALRNCGYLLPAKRITINLTPANIRKSGAGFDLPIAVAILTALGVTSQEQTKGIIVIGQVSLSGEILPVEGVLPIVAAAWEQGFERCMVPTKNEREAEFCGKMQVIGVSHLREVIRYLNGEDWREKKETINIEETGKISHQELDFAEINGQKLLKRACELAVSGMHNILMIGPPGAGKTMASKRMAGIMPKLELEEQMELAKIYSVSGMFEQWEQNRDVRPFRSPHHTITEQALAGGGREPKPGEISLAHRGILFLDEMTEFRKTTLEILRQPLEDKQIHLVRLYGSYTYPADFMLVAAMNPCGCGFYPDMQKCRCTPATIDRYLSKISQPLLDRIDICVEAPKIEFQELNGSEQNENSATIRKRVEAVREIQRERFKGQNIYFNSQMTAADIKKYCKLDEKSQKYMEDVYDQLNLSARSYHKLLKVARTIADLDGSEQIGRNHLNEAVCYRSIDKKFWDR